METDWIDGVIRNIQGSDLTGSEHKRFVNVSLEINKVLRLVTLKYKQAEKLGLLENVKRCDYCNKENDNRKVCSCGTTLERTINEFPIGVRVKKLKKTSRGLTVEDIERI